MFGPQRPVATRLPAGEPRLGKVISTGPLSIDVDGLPVVSGVVEVAYGLTVAPGDACVVLCFGSAFYLVTSTYDDGGV